jgi:hypothetical protein
MEADAAGTSPPYPPYCDSRACVVMGFTRARVVGR